MQTYSKVLDKVYTREDADLLIREIETLTDSLYKTGDADFERAMQGSVRKTTAEKIRAALDDFRGEKDEFLHGLKEAVHQQKAVTVTLAFEPSEKVITRISEWILEQLGKGTILDLLYDPTVIGGAVIMYGGHYADYSLSKKLKKILGELVVDVQQVNKQ